MVEYETRTEDKTYIQNFGGKTSWKAASWKTEMVMGG
jgi:hypothetical protein